VARVTKLVVTNHTGVLLLTLVTCLPLIPDFCIRCLIQNGVNAFSANLGDKDPLRQNHGLLAYRMVIPLPPAYGLQTGYGGPSVACVHGG